MSRERFTVTGVVFQYIRMVGVKFFTVIISLLGY